MQHAIVFQKDRDLYEIRVSGKATVEGFEKIDMEILAHPSWTPGMRVLWDLRELDLGGMSAEDTRASSDSVRRLSDRFGNARFACVMGKEVDFGIARMFEMMTSPGTQLEIRIFRTMPEAQSWIEG